MKLTFAMVGAVVAANQEFPVVEKKSPEQILANTNWHIHGIKGYYDGFYKSLYKKKLPETMKECLNDETAKNIANFMTILNDPFHMKMTDIQKDFNMFAQMAEIMENLATCRFEAPLFDVLGQCTKNPLDCALPKVTENVTKNMFVLIGKMTSLAETLQGFPSKNADTYEEQMRELGSTGGTWGRVVINFQHSNSH